MNGLSPRISIITGVVRAGDAISEAVRADLNSLDLLSRRRRWNIDVRVYCGSAAVDDTRVHVVNDRKELLRRAHFQTSNLYIYHFGVYHDLHDTVSFARRDSLVVNYFHNVTPPQYCARGSEDLLHKSFQQIELFRAADVHLSASSFSARQLEEYLDTSVEVVPLFGPNESPQRIQRVKETKGTLNILYCGRFSEAKGLTILIDALSRVSADPTCPLSVTLAGLVDFSDRDHIRSLQFRAQNLPQCVSVRFALNMQPEELRIEYSNADVFVLPSFHEGFGMTAVEAFSFETPVICSNAAALPEVTTGLALSFPAGNSEALAEALERFREVLWQDRILCDSGVFSREAWAKKVRLHAASLSRNEYIEKAVLRFGGWLDSIREPSVSYRERLEESMADVYGPADEQISSTDAALRGAVVAMEVADLLEKETDRGIAELLRWLSGRMPDDADIAYWRGELSRVGLRQVLKELADSQSVRESNARMQASVFLQGFPPVVQLPKTLTSVSAMRRTTPSSVLEATMRLWTSIRQAYRSAWRKVTCPRILGRVLPAIKLPRVTMRKVESARGSPKQPAPIASQKSKSGTIEICPKLILSEMSKASNADFLRNAYRRILSRDADTEGFRTYLRKLDARILTRKSLLNDMLASKERAALVARNLKR